MDSSNPLTAPKVTLFCGSGCAGAHDELIERGGRYAQLLGRAPALGL